MKGKEKYKKLILEKNLASSAEEVNVMAETLYQIAYITVKSYLESERR